MEFLSLSNASDVLKILETGVRSHQLIPLLGCFGSGKSHLLEYFSRTYWEQEKGVQSPPRIVYAKLWEPPSKAGNRYATQAACMIFTEIAFGLAQISQRYSPELIHATKIWYRRPQSLYTDSQFTSLFAFVRDELKRLQVSAIILDNATQIDIYALQRLMQCRRLLNHDLAFIFSARIEAPGTINDMLSRNLETVIPAEDIQPRIELKPLRVDDVARHIFRHLMLSYTIGFPENMPKATIQRIRASFWEEAGGNWHRIANTARRMRDLLKGEQDGTLTLERWEAIIGKPLPEEKAIEA